MCRGIVDIQTSRTLIEPWIWGQIQFLPGIPCLQKVETELGKNTVTLSAKNQIKRRNKSVRIQRGKGATCDKMGMRETGAEILDEFKSVSREGDHRVNPDKSGSECGDLFQSLFTGEKCAIDRVNGDLLLLQLGG
jgi:hypothetical protein